MPPELLRKFLYARASESVFKDYLKHPLPNPGQTVLESEFLALDFETTGLKPKSDRILSMGYTVIKNGRVCLNENGYFLVNPKTELNNENVSIHKITDDEAEQGLSLTQALTLLLEKMRGRFVIAHHAPIETGFLNAACRNVFKHNLPMRVIDTLKIEQKRLQHRQQLLDANQLRLFNIRSSYNLPRYRAHNALEDAIATAELFLAMVSYRDELSKCKVKEFL